MFPSKESTAFLHIVKPRPIPWELTLFTYSRFVNRENKFFCISDFIPQPESDTLIFKNWLWNSELLISIVIVINPLIVYLIEL